jgi:hypothetical protein
MQFTITKQHVEQMIQTLKDGDDAVIANRGGCNYANPCIIGSVMDKDFIQHLDRNNALQESIQALHGSFVLFDNDVDAYEIYKTQEAFDNPDSHEVDEVIYHLNLAISGV